MLRIHDIEIPSDMFWSLGLELCNHAAQLVEPEDKEALGWIVATRYRMRIRKVKTRNKGG